jgi:glycosyltransferase involved in cell wall biosynthesis
MKILYTTHQFLPDHSTGTELLTYMTAAQMRENGHFVQIVTGFPVSSHIALQNLFDRYTYDGLIIHRYYHHKKKSIGKQCIMAAEYANSIVKKWFRSIIKQFRPDVIHIFHLQRLSASILEVCRENKIPVIITATDFWMICPTTQLLLYDHSMCLGPRKMMENCVKHLSKKSSSKFLSNHICKIPDKIIRYIIYILGIFPIFRVGFLENVYALSKRQQYIVSKMETVKRIFVTNNFMNDILVRHDIPANIIQKIPFGIFPLNSSKFPKKQTTDKLQVGFIGTLDFHKGAHVLIKALRCMPKSEEIDVRIYGDTKQFPDYFKHLQEISQEDPRLHFTGTFPPDRIGIILSSLDILVVPSLWFENTPLIILQAQDASLPIIASNLYGINEIIVDGLNGFLFDPGNEKQLSEIIKRLINDNSILDEMRFIENQPLHIDEYALILEKEYREITNEK